MHTPDDPTDTQSSPSTRCGALALFFLLFSPLQLVVWLPALCRKMDVPYCIVKSKARLGMVVHKKTATCLALTDVKAEDQASLAKLVDSVRLNFNDRSEEVRRKWGGNILGSKAQDKLKKLERARAREEAARTA